MNNSISRRDFLKLVKAGGAATLGLSGCGRMARYVTRSPYREMPEYQLPGESVHYATTCQECPAGCGLVVRTVEGRAIKVEGNPAHPVNRGRTCLRGQAAVQGLYDPDRIQGPFANSERGSSGDEEMSWEEAVEVLAEALGEEDPKGIAVCLGLTPDHVFDFFRELTGSLGAHPPYRYDALGMFEARRTLQSAAGVVFGKEQIPYFNFQEADLVLSFGANFTETWISPVAYNLAYGEMRQGRPGQRGTLIHFESRMSQTAANADHWVPIRPGTAGIVAAGIGKLAADFQGVEMPPSYQALSVEDIVASTGVTRLQLEEVAEVYAQAERKIALPGGSALGHEAGYQHGVHILALNHLNTQRDWSGITFIPRPPLEGVQPGGPSSLDELKALVEKMSGGQISTLLIQGADPIFELPPELGFEQALENVDRVISFQSLRDETTRWADYVFPNHTPLESWGYQRTMAAGDRMTVSAAQPVVAPLYDTQSTIDVVLSALQHGGEQLAGAMAYRDEVDFLQRRLEPLMADGGSFQAEVIEGFWSKFLQHGGWWKAESGLGQVVLAPDRFYEMEFPELGLPVPQRGLDEFYFAPYPMAKLGDGSGANRPWLQETPDAMTTVMWNTWAEINPITAQNLGVKDDDLIEIQTSQGSIQVPVYVFPGIRPDTIAVPFGGGHSALGRYAEGRGVNPLEVIEVLLNESGDLAYDGQLVTIKALGKVEELARYESREGVYGVEDK